ncbi:Gfo/Idh/MocA family protein [Arenibacter echinorum]|uniref:Putative dehydrogenase n=1 Tax=Arenibacter echinorum TaxID=440515 RepID=A0A327RCB8_9FLAO|nr:Gfo/Idh/MocA family oxidoreductase [Arenibacter echinorum]RAJ13765.1 putative dehydrogenase [Arenibacter echinorum]
MDNRRDFIKKTTLASTGVVVGASAFSAKSYGNIMGANDRVVLGSIGVRGRGSDLLENFSEMYDNGVRIKTVCDVDSAVLGDNVKTATKNQKGNKPGTEEDMRRVFEDKEIDAVIVAVPNHWHALATIWACQAGKHVYVEKPSSHNVWEGRKMVEAARKYNRVVQVGFQNRSISNVMQAMDFLHRGGIGEVFLSRGTCFKPRDSFGISPDSVSPSTLNYDLWLGPAAYRPYNEKKGHYNWHWHWDTGNGDTGNQGPHQFDIARWGLNKKVHPVKVQSMGGIFGFTPQECSQETPNTQTSVFEYGDGKILEFETRGRYTNHEANLGVKIGNMFYGTEGWMEVNGSTWKAYKGKETEPFAGSEMAGSAAVGGDTSFLTAPDSKGHYGNFIDGVRSGNRHDLNCDIETGHMSTVLPLIANIALRVGETLKFNGEFEKFINNEEADLMLTRKYRYPYIVPENV